MPCRRRCTKTAVTLWALVATIDIVLLVAAVGVLTVVLAVAGAAVVAASVVGLWMLGHRPRPAAMPRPMSWFRRGR
jgi:uncharacterized membrane protein YfbV (UPF0208 family)